MNLDLRGYKKIRENENSATLEHPLGHQIKIAKRVLSPENQNELSKLKLAGGGVVQHFVNGGMSSEVKDPYPNDPTFDQSSRGSIYGRAPSDEDLQQEAAAVPKGGGADEERQLAQNGAETNFPDAQPAQQAIDQSNDQAEQTPQSSPQPTVVINNTPAPQGQTPQPSSPPQQNAPQGQVPMPVPNQYSQQQDPYGANAYGNVSKEGLQNVAQGTQAEAGAQNQVNQAQAAAMAPGIAAQQQHLDDYQQRTNDLRSEYQNFIQDYKDQHINSNHVFENMGTGSKIAIGIGLLLGGHNTMDFLNKQISNDIEAQKANMDQGKNLLSANMQQFGNERDASTMTEIMQRGIIANQMQEAALKSGNPLLKAKAQQAVGQFELQNNALMGQIAMRQTLQNGPGGQASTANGTPQMPQQGAMNQIDPATKIRLMGQVGYLNPSQVEESQKQLQSAQNMSAQRDNLFDAFDKLDKINTLENRYNPVFGAPIQTPKQVNAIEDPLLAQLVKDSEGRITPTDTQMLRGLFPAPGDDVDTITQKRNQMQAFINEKMHYPLLDSMGINPAPKSRYSPSGKNKVTESAPNLNQ